MPSAGSWSSGGTSSADHETGKRQKQTFLCLCWRWALAMEPNGYRKEKRRMSGGGVENDLDPWTAWAYKPRTISLLLIGACLLMGVWAMVAVFLAYSLLQAPSTVLIRPHPAIWRLVHGMAVIYLIYYMLAPDTKV